MSSTIITNLPPSSSPSCSFLPKFNSPTPTSTITTTQYLKEAPVKIGYQKSKMYVILTHQGFNPSFKRKPNGALNFLNCLNSTNPNFVNSFSPSSSISNLHLSPHQNLDIPQISSSGGVSLRLERLVSEFRLLPEPVDRVKRLLDYAAVLPRVDESNRSQENRVAGCAAQVWVEVGMDEMGRMWFRADSDSEITKGFCSCLIYLLNSALPEEVLKVKAEDLTDMNVGLPVRSRVNSWNNVLISMRERTRILMEQKREDLVPLQSFSSLVISADTVIAKGEVLLPWL